MARYPAMLTARELAEQQEAAIDALRHIDNGAIFGKHRVERHQPVTLGPGQ